MKTILLILLSLVIGFGAAWYWLNGMPQKTAATLPVQTTVTEANPFFTFLDTYTPQNGERNSQVLFIRPQFHQLVFSYSTSEEGIKYGVYDYKNNKLYTDIGGSAIGDTDMPIGLISNDRVVHILMDDTDAPPKFVVKDFKNNVVAQVPSIVDPDFKYFDRSDEYNGKIEVTFKTTQGGPGLSEYQNYSFDENTLTFIAQK